MIGYLQTLLAYGILVVLSVIAIAYVYFSHLYSYFKRRGYPFEPPTFPLGNLWPVFTLHRSYSTFLSDLYSRYKGEEFVGFFQLGKKSVLIIDRDLVKNVLVKDFDSFDGKSIHYDRELEPLTAHLFALHGEEWRSLRRRLVPAYSSGRLKDMFGIVTAVGRELTEYIDRLAGEQSEVECKEIFIRYGLAMVASTAFGIDSGVFNDISSEFVKSANDLVPPTLEGMFRTSVQFYACEIAQALKIRVFPKASHDFFFNLVKDTIQHRTDSGTTRHDFLQLLIQLQSGPNEEPGLTLDEVAAQAFVFILAGFETVSNTMSFCLYELAMNPALQQRVLDEVDSVVDVTYQSLASMEFLEMVIDEVLRKHTSLPFLSRVCTRDYVTPGGRMIEKGTQVVVSLKGLHYDPEYFPDPHALDPERFSKHNKHSLVPFSYLPFGEGPRMCIGMRFGRLNVKAGLATLLRGFRVDRSPRTPYPLRYQVKTISTTAEGGLWLRFSLRAKQD